MWEDTYADDVYASHKGEGDSFFIEMELQTGLVWRIVVTTLVKVMNAATEKYIFHFCPKLIKITNFQI